MTESKKSELMQLLEERALSDFERRRRRLLSIPTERVGPALRKAREETPLTREEFIVVNFGSLPEELFSPEQLEALERMGYQLRKPSGRCKHKPLIKVAGDIVRLDPLNSVRQGVEPSPARYMC